MDEGVSNDLSDDDNDRDGEAGAFGDASTCCFLSFLEASASYSGWDAVLFLMSFDNPMVLPSRRRDEQKKRIFD